MDSSGAQEISRVGPDGWAWASSPGAFTVPPWCKLLRILCPAPAGATSLSTASSPGRTRDAAWALKPWETGFPDTRPPWNETAMEREGTHPAQSGTPGRWMEGTSAGL